MKSLNGTMPTAYQSSYPHITPAIDTTIDWAVFGPTMDGRQVDSVGKFSRSKRFEMMNPHHARRDPSFPQGFTISGRPGSKMLWFTKDIKAWVEARAERFRQNPMSAKNTSARSVSSSRKAGGRA